MSVADLISARVEMANGSCATDAWRRRIARLGLAHDIFRALERVSVEMEDSRRLESAAVRADEDGDTIGASFDRKRGELARRAAGRELFSSAVGFFALVRMAGVSAGAAGALVAALDKEESEWLSAVLGAGL